MDIATLFAKVSAAIEAYRNSDWKKMATLALEIFQAFLFNDEPIRMQSTQEFDFRALMTEADSLQKRVGDHDEGTHAFVARALFKALIEFVNMLFGF